MSAIHDRRGFFNRVALGVAHVVCDTVDAARAAAGHRREETNEPVRPWVRPPGALAEEVFLKTCTRCTECQAACPYQSVRRLGPEWGEAAGTPAIIPTESPCYLCPDTPCISACEPKALLPVAPRAVSMGLAVLRREDCYLTNGQPCDYCVARCPLRGEAIRFDPDRLPVIDAAHCTGCGMCVYLCPPGAIDINPTSRKSRGFASEGPKCRDPLP